MWFFGKVGVWLGPTVVVDHDLDIAENLAVAPVRLLLGLCEESAAILASEYALGLRIEHEWDGEEALDPLWLSVLVMSGNCKSPASICCTVRKSSQLAS